MKEEEFAERFLDEDGNLKEEEFAREIGAQVSELREMYAETTNRSKYRENMREALERRIDARTGNQEPDAKIRVCAMDGEPDHLRKARQERINANMANAKSPIKGLGDTPEYNAIKGFG